MKFSLKSNDNTTESGYDKNGDTIMSELVENTLGSYITTFQCLNKTPSPCEEFTIFSKTLQDWVNNDKQPYYQDILPLYKGKTPAFIAKALQTINNDAAVAMPLVPLKFFNQPLYEEILKWLDLFASSASPPKVATRSENINRLLEGISFPIENTSTLSIEEKINLTILALNVVAYFAPEDNDFSRLENLIGDYPGITVVAQITGTWEGEDIFRLLVKENNLRNQEGIGRKPKKIKTPFNLNHPALSGDEIKQFPGIFDPSLKPKARIDKEGDLIVKIKHKDDYSSQTIHYKFDKQGRLTRKYSFDGLNNVSIERYTINPDGVKEKIWFPNLTMDTNKLINSYGHDIYVIYSKLNSQGKQLFFSNRSTCRYNQYNRTIECTTDLPNYGVQFQYDLNELQEVIADSE